MNFVNILFPLIDPEVMRGSFGEATFKCVPPVRKQAAGIGVLNGMPPFGAAKMPECSEILSRSTSEGRD